MTPSKAVVTQRRKTIWKHNPVSGHEWPEHEYLNQWEVVGGQSDRIFKSEERAQEWADYLNGGEHDSFQGR